MSEVLAAALLAGLLCGLGGLLVPRLVASIPEPEPEPEREPEPEPEREPERELEPDRVPEDEQAPPPKPPKPPKEEYAAIAALPGLGPRSALAAAVVGALIGAATGLDWPLLWLVPLVPVGVALAVVDWRTRLLPKRVVKPATLATLLLVLAVGLGTGDGEALVRALVGMVVVFVFFWLLWVFSPAGIGYGDVRLSGVLGLVLAWVGWGALAIGVWVGFATFGLPGLVLALVRRDRTLLKKLFPYGPFMLVGAVVGLVWGTPLAARIWG